MCQPTIMKNTVRHPGRGNCDPGAFDAVERVFPPQGAGGGQDGAHRFPPGYYLADRAVTWPSGSREDVDDTPQDVDHHRDHHPEEHSRKGLSSSCCIQGTGSLSCSGGLMLGLRSGSMWAIDGAMRCCDSQKPTGTRRTSSRNARGALQQQRGLPPGCRRLPICVMNTSHTDRRRRIPIASPCAPRWCLAVTSLSASRAWSQGWAWAAAMAGLLRRDLRRAAAGQPPSDGAGGHCAGAAGAPHRASTALLLVITWC